VCVRILRMGFFILNEYPARSVRYLVCYGLLNVGEAYKM